MSNTYGAEIDELFTTPSERVQRLTSPSQYATQLGISDIDEDPEAAARAIQLSRATGTPAPVIHGDLEGFERDHKQRLVSEMIRNSEALTDYVNTFPMASKVSNDDYPNLEELGRTVRKAFGPIGGFDTGSILEGIKEGWGDEDILPPPEEFKKALDYFGPQGVQPVLGFSATMALLSRAFKAGVHGLAKGGAAYVADQTPGLDESDRGRIEREIGSMLEWAMNRGDIGTIQPKFSPKQVKDAVEVVKPYVEAGEVPPPGVFPWLDELKVDEAKTDLKGLQETQRAVRSSKTFERSADAGEHFLRQQVGDRQIGISADAVAELYGTKRPMPDDGLLGWVPDLEQQLQVAAASGGDIKVPLAGWLARMDPQVAKQLEEHLRLRPEGVTKFEGEGLEPPKPVEGQAPPRDPRSVEDLARREAEFEPLAQVGDRGIRLELAKPEAMTDVDKLVESFSKDERPGSKLFHVFDNGQHAASVWLRPGRTIYIEDIYSTAREGVGAPNTIGLHAVRGLMEELKRLYPEAEKVTGFRVSGAREKASFEQGKQKIGVVEVSLKASPQELANFVADVFGIEDQAQPGAIVGKLGNATVEFRPKELLTEKENELVSSISTVLDQLAPGVDFYAVDRAWVKAKGMEREGQIHAAYQPTASSGFPYIIVAASSRDPIGAALHEVIHHLRSGYFKAEEWSTLERAAQEGDWIKKHRTDKNYPEAPRWFQTEEAIAEEYRAWSKEKFLQERQPAEVLKIFQRLKELFEQLSEAVRQAIGQHLSVDQLFTRVSTGEIGARAPSAIGGARFTTFAMATAAEEAQLFAKGAAVGMTQAQFKRYMQLIEQKNKEIEERAQRRLERTVQVTKTEQWKENEPRVRQEVTEAINQRPDVMADDFFRRGLLNGEKVERPKFDTEFLTPEQQKGIGPGLHREGGANPNDVAGLFGYFTGESLIESLVNIQTARQALGMSPEAYKKKLVRDATERTMMKRYGVPEHDSLLREAREDIITETQMDMLAEETMALATKTGQAPAFVKDQLKASVKQSFAQSKMADARDMEGFLRQAGKAGRAAELGLLKGDPTEAFRQKQRQYIATLYANEAKALAKEETRLEKTAKRLAPREVKNLEHEFVDYAQTLVRMAGYAGRRDIPELQAALAKNGFKDFESFIGSKQADGWEISAPTWVTDFNIPKLDEMTTQQFREFKDVVDSLVHTAREAKQVEVLGAAKDFEEFKQEVRENLQQLPLRPPDAPKGFWGKFKNGLWRMDASLAKPEEILKDLDLRQELGPLWGAVFHPLVDAKHTEMGMQERLTKDLNEIKGFGRKWRKTLDDPIPNDFFVDPYFPDKPPFELKRSDLIGIMLNWGNRSNIKKFTEGYAGKDGAAALEVHLKSLMDRYATKEDWDFVQKVWDTFETIRKDSDTMYYRMSGVTPKWIGPEAVQTPHGNYAGGYFPVFWDPSRSRMESRMKGTYFDKNFQQSTTSNHYTIERTEYADRINFRGAADMIASRYQQMIHDISHREAIMNAQKVLGDKDLRSDIRRHYGEEYLTQLDHTFKNLANRFNVHEEQLAFWNDWARKARFNVIVHALGLNLRVILSPATGKFGPSDIPSMIANWGENHALGMEKSRELPHTFRNMDRDFRERLEQSVKKGSWSQFKENAFKWSMAPTVYVDQQFRALTFVNEYKDAKARGLSEGEAVSVADSAVRERHGAAGVADMAGLMQTNNEWMKLGTLFYGFFNTMYNWQRQIPGQVRRGQYMEAIKTGWWSVLVPAAIGSVLFNSAKEDDSIFKIGAKGIALQLASTIPLARELANLFIEGQPSRSPWGSIIQSLKSSYTDVTGKPDPKRKVVQHTANVIGLTQGLPMGQIGRTAQFAADVQANRQHPRNIWEYIRGIIHGEAQLKKGTGR